MDKKAKGKGQTRNYLLIVDCCLPFALCLLPFAQKKGPHGNGARQPKLTAYEKNCMTTIY